jgi:hypothetical protein
MRRTRQGSRDQVRPCGVVLALELGREVPSHRALEAASVTALEVRLEARALGSRKLAASVLVE